MIKERESGHLLEREDTMKIEVLGDGCTKCKALRKRVQQAVDELGIQAEVSAVMDLERIADLHTMSLPQLYVNGQALPSDKLMSINGIKEFLSTVQKQT